MRQELWSQREGGSQMARLRYTNPLRSQDSSPLGVTILHCRKRRQRACMHMHVYVYIYVHIYRRSVGRRAGLRLGVDVAGGGEVVIGGAVAAKVGRLHADADLRVMRPGAA